MLNMPNIAVFFKHPDPMGAPFSDPDYFRAYQELTHEVSKAGGELFVVRDIASYLGDARFRTSWQLRNGVVEETGELTADVIFNKGQATFDTTVPVFNHPELSAICTDKWHMYSLFSQFCPKTIRAENVSEAKKAIELCQTDTIVLKPLTGAEGRDILIVEPAEAVSSVQDSKYPIIVQEFLDTSVGVPGLQQGIHDFRLAIIDGTVVYAEIRTPPPGSLQANVAKGGTFTIYKPDQAPESVLSIAREIDSHLQQFGHRFYSIDFGFTKFGPRIIEMNSEVGILPNSDGVIFQTVKQKLAQILISLAL